MQRRPALVVCLVHSSTLLHQEANDVQVLIYAGLRTGTSSHHSARAPPRRQRLFYKGRPGDPGPTRAVESNADGLQSGPPATSRVKCPGHSMSAPPEHEEFMETGAGSRARMKEWAWSTWGCHPCKRLLSRVSRWGAPEPRHGLPKDMRLEQTAQ